MPLNPSTFCDRAVMALYRLVGGPYASVRIERDVPALIHVPGARLIIAAGDHITPLDCTRLKTLALRQSCSVMATYVDPYRSGHRFVIDAVLWQGGEAMLYPEYRLWLSSCGVTALAPDPAPGAWLSLSAAGFHRVAESDFDAVATTTGIARGHALLHQQIYGGTHFATPRPGDHHR